MARSKNNPSKGFNKIYKPYTKGPTHHSSNDASDDAPKNKVFNPCKYYGRTNHPKNV